jgi:phage terminase small subunit
MAFSGRVQKFINGCIQGKTGTKAAVDAGFSKRTAHVQASRLLRNAKVRAAVDEGLEKARQKATITAAEVILELKRIALTDISMAFNEDGSLKPLHKMPEDVRRAIAGVDVDELFEGQGRDRERVGETKKIRFWDKNRALELLGKHLKLYTDRVEVVDGLASRLAEARKRAKAG